MKKSTVISDEVAGKIAKQLWEIERDVLNGTRDPLKTLASLLQLQKCGILPFELPLYEVSSQIYSLDIPSRKDLMKEIETVAKSLGKHFYKQYFVPSSFTGPRKSKVRLAQVTGGRRMLWEALEIFENDGETLADPWELLEFIKKSKFTKVAPQGAFLVHCLVPVGKYQYPEEKHSVVNLQLRAKAETIGDTVYPKGWEVDIKTAGNTYEIQQHDYVLLRCK